MSISLTFVNIVVVVDIIINQVDEIVYAQFSTNNAKTYLAQIISVDNKRYNIYFMDGDSRLETEDVRLNF